MAIEIERKFLVVDDAWRSVPGVYFCQGYLSRDPARTVRVRIAAEQAFMTIKGLNQGASRVEFEYGIPLADARALLQLCDGPLIEKYRRNIPYEGLLWEVDEFLGENLGLIVAEVELSAEDQVFVRPAWVGEEVTQDKRYYNSNLTRLPYSQW